MKIEIKNRCTNEIILCGEYESIKDCLEKNSGTNLRGADLGGADLGGANLGGANLRDAYLRGAYLGGVYLRGADLGGANLSGTDLSGTNLRGANLSGTNLRGANLSSAYFGGAYLEGADLRGARCYVSNHDFWIEIIKRQPLETFTEKEWAIIGQVYVHKLCWDSIKKRYSENIMPIFKKLSEVGFKEWEEEYKKVLKAD